VTKVAPVGQSDDPGLAFTANEGSGERAEYLQMGPYPQPSRDELRTPNKPAFDKEPGHPDGSRCCTCVKVGAAFRGEGGNTLVVPNEEVEGLAINPGEAG